MLPLHANKCTKYQDLGLSCDLIHRLEYVVFTLWCNSRCAFKPKRASWEGGPKLCMIKHGVI